MISSWSQSCTLHVVTMVPTNPWASIYHMFGPILRLSDCWCMERMHAWWQPPACTWGIFIPEIWETVVWYFFQKSYNYVLCFHFCILPPIKFVMDHTIASSPDHSPFTSKRRGGNIRVENRCKLPREKCGTNQIAAFLHVTKYHVKLWVCTTDYSSRVCDQAGDKCEDKQNTRGLAIACMTLLSGCRNKVVWKFRTNMSSFTIACTDSRDYLHR